MRYLALIPFITLIGCVAPAQHVHYMTDYNGVWVEAIQTSSGTVLYKVYETTGAL